jgi:hypothetical protein
VVLIGIEEAKTAATLNEFLLKAENRKLVLNKTDLLYDGWGNAIEWQVTSELSCTTIRITSSGQNAVLEKGNGDDLWVEITLTKDSNNPVVGKNFQW